MPSTDSSDRNGVSLTRRRMVLFGGTGVLAGLAATLAWPRFSGTTGTRATGEKPALPAAGKASGPTAPVPSASTVDAGSFQPFIGQEFLIESPAGEKKCKLVSITPETRQDTFKGSFVSFSLIFESTGGIPADGATCRVKHPDMEPMEIFLSPIGDGKNKILLEAAFSARI